MFFFFKQKTAYEMVRSDWSSDVCSSDLITRERALARDERGGVAAAGEPLHARAQLGQLVVALGPLQRAAVVIRDVAAELARQLAVRGHSGGVEPVIVLRLLLAGVQPRE